MELTPKEKIIKDFLIKCAKNGRTITYQNLCIVAKLGLDMNNFIVSGYKITVLIQRCNRSLVWSPIWYQLSYEFLSFQKS